MLESYLVDILKDKFGQILNSTNQVLRKYTGIISVQFIGLNNEILVKRLSPIMAVSTGSACSSAKPSHVLAASCLYLDEVRQTIRISLSPYISKEDLEVFLSL